MSTPGPLRPHDHSQKEVATFNSLSTSDERKIVCSFKSTNWMRATIVNWNAMQFAMRGIQLRVSEKDISDQWMSPRSSWRVFRHSCTSPTRCGRDAMYFRPMYWNTNRESTVPACRSILSNWDRRHLLKNQMTFLLVWLSTKVCSIIFDPASLDKDRMVHSDNLKIDVYGKSHPPPVAANISHEEWIVYHHHSNSHDLCIRS